MTREAFLKLVGLFGLGLPLTASINKMPGQNNSPKAFKGKVLIIGAGAGGLSAGYFLQQQGTDFEILEASPTYGGRMAIATDFADFPIPMGAEWLETNPRIFNEIVNDPKVKVEVETVSDFPDRKFVNYSWFNFFEDYVVPSIASKISYNTIVTSVDYTGAQIQVTTQNGAYTADKVIIAVPLKILQDGDIDFRPKFPEQKLKAIAGCRVWEGFKAFFAFSTKFYEDEYDFRVQPRKDGQKLYYNAALGQNTDKNILGLFVVGTPAQEYISRSGEALKQYILRELDSIYENQATPSYINHITKNWNEAPFIKGGYMTDHANWKTVRLLGLPVANKVFFAGGAYTDGEDWVSVHTAAESARKAVNGINS